MITIATAINSLYSNAEFVVRGDVYEGIEWHSTDIPMPSKDDVEREVARLQSEYENNEYQRNRASEYPSFADQFDLLYHGGLDAWKAEIDKVKNKYPKPKGSK